MKKTFLLIGVLVFLSLFSFASTGKDLINMLTDTLQGIEEPAPIPNYYTEIKTEYFSFLIPPNLDTQIKEAEYSSSVAFGKGEINYGRIIVGEVHEKVPLKDVVSDSVTYLLKDSKNFSILQQETLASRGIINLFKIKLDNYLVWMVIFSESDDAEYFGTGEYMIFLATDLGGEDFFWDKIYHDMIISLNF